MVFKAFWITCVIMLGLAGGIIAMFRWPVVAFVLMLAAVVLCLGAMIFVTVMDELE